MANEVLVQREGAKEEAALAAVHKEERKVLLSSLVSPFPANTEPATIVHEVEKFYGLQDEWIEDHRGPMFGDVDTPQGAYMFKVYWDKEEIVEKNRKLIAAKGLQIGTGKDGTIWIGCNATISKVPEVWLSC